MRPHAVPLCLLFLVCPASCCSKSGGKGLDFTTARITDSTTASATAVSTSAFIPASVKVSATVSTPIVTPVTTIASSTSSTPDSTNTSAQANNSPSSLSSAASASAFGSTYSTPKPGAIEFTNFPDLFKNSSSASVLFNSSRSKSLSSGNFTPVKHSLSLKNITSCCEKNGGRSCQSADVDVSQIGQGDLKLPGNLTAHFNRNSTDSLNTYIYSCPEADVIVKYISVMKALNGYAMYRDRRAYSLEPCGQGGYIWRQLPSWTSLG